MRRRSLNVVGREGLLPERIAAAERHDPARVIALLEPLVLERRRDRLLQVIAQRLGSVTVLFDAPHDPHNGAAVVRTCEAFGVQTIHVVQRKETFLAASSVSKGAEKWVDVLTYDGSAGAIAAVRADAMEMVGADPEGELAPEDLAAIPRLCLVLGNERDGITADLGAACTRRVRVPMRGFIDSLNVSVTAAIMLSHATKNRVGDLDAATRLRLYARGLYFTVPKADQVLEEFA